MTYEIAMNVKKEIPTGSVTLTIQVASARPRLLSVFSAEVTKKPAYLK